MLRSRCLNNFERRFDDRLPPPNELIALHSYINVTYARAWDSNGLTKTMCLCSRGHWTGNCFPTSISSLIVEFVYEHPHKSNCVWACDNCRQFIRAVLYACVRNSDTYEYRRLLSHNRGIYSAIMVQDSDTVDGIAVRIIWTFVKHYILFRSGLRYELDTCIVCINFRLWQWQ